MYPIACNILIVVIEAKLHCGYANVQIESSYYEHNAMHMDRLRENSELFVRIFEKKCIFG